MSLYNMDSNYWWYLQLENVICLMLVAREQLSALSPGESSEQGMMATTDVIQEIVNIL